MTKKTKSFFINFPIILLILLVSFALGVKFAIKRTFGATAVGEILTTLRFPVVGTNPKIVCFFIVRSFFYALIPGAFLTTILFWKTKHRVVKRCAVVVISFLLFTVTFLSNIKEACQTQTSYDSPNELLRNYYVAPDKVEITFPDKKRNLVYILVESLETTFFQKAHGGAMDDDVIPELYRLANDNVCFSVNDDCLGMIPSRDSWTIAAIVAQTSGIPFIVPWNDYTCPANVKFLPGATGIFDILHKNGYKQVYICGSDVHFEGTDNFLKTHKVDYIYDLNTARREHFISAKYHDGWWGMEDNKTFTYVKEKLTKIAKSPAPFVCVISTIDTHFFGGNFREDCCKHQFEDDWMNVYACTSRQVSAFVEWLKAQPFYANTTIVITGDHPTRLHDDTFDIVPKDYHQHIYNCFINSPVTPLKEKNREFTLYDIFPTILASLGCKIQGDRLALGTNLFSGRPTLYEELGEEDFWEKFGTEKPKNVEFWENFGAGNSQDYDELFSVDHHKERSKCDK